MILEITASIIFGWYLKTIWYKITTYVNNKKISDDITKQFSDVLDNLKNNKTTFKTRVNNTVYIETNISDHGLVNLVLLMDRNDIALFKENKCIYVSNTLDKSIISDIINQCTNLYADNINNIVPFFGTIYYKPDFDKALKSQTQSNLKLKNESSDIQKIIKNNQKKLSLDDILDKIGEQGIDKLTEEERQFLKNQK